jgi:homopolymeric O-antigen transport system ATP-binding protein
MAIAVRADGLGKRYQLGRLKPGVRTFREALVHGASALVHRNGASRPAGEMLWALRDVSFEVAEGEIVGIIGRNGAGKSTLLKILSRITEPTEGYAEIRGRVGSLLEVGTGFHTELTGRENVWLSGAILGMRRAEIHRRFDQIVEFAEVERFIDTPVKHYSSGMYLRLAFAVAAHFEPDVLIVDEVLAVGDASFQKKCLGRMQAVSRGEGRTVLFVSHNLDAIQRLCGRCLLLDDGRLVAAGDTASVLSEYAVTHLVSARPEEWIDLSHASRMGTGEARVTAVRYRSPLAAHGGHAVSDEPLDVDLAISTDTDRDVGSIAVTIYSLSGTKLVNADSVELGTPVRLRKGDNRVRVAIEQLHLNPGTYRLGVWMADPLRTNSGKTAFDYVESAFDLDVIGKTDVRFGITPGSAVPCRFSMAVLT